MKKISLIITLLLIITPAFAQTAEELMERFQYHRNTVYKQLNLTEQQTKKIKKIDENVYTKLEPELQQVSNFINQIDEIAKSDNCTIERVNAVKEEFKTTEERISIIKEKHEKAINRVLTSEQKTAYEKAKEAQRAEIQKEIENLQKEQINNGQA